MQPNIAADHLAHHSLRSTADILQVNITGHTIKEAGNVKGCRSRTEEQVNELRTGHTRDIIKHRLLVAICDGQVACGRSSKTPTHTSISEED
jgi:hypothetical protein